MFSDDDENFSGDDSDDGFQEDMEALKKACLLVGKDADDLQPSSSTLDIPGCDATADVTPSGTDDDDDNDDIELVRSIQERFALSTELFEPLTMKPLCSFPPVGDEDDDFETLRAIQRRFAAFNDDSEKGRKESALDKSEQVGVTNITSEKETCNNFFVERTNAEEGFPACVDEISEGCNNDIATVSQNLVDSGVGNTAVSVSSFCFPKSAQAFVDAIKKNRSCQKIIRNKMMQTEARIEELNKLKERVKILKSFQLACRKRMGRALSQKRDARVQLISLPKQRVNSKLQGKRSAIYYGPPENSHVASFREALAHFAVSLSRKEWSNEQKEKLAKGVKQQFQEMMLKEMMHQHSVNLLSDEDGCSGESGDIDGLIASIRDLVIAPEIMRSFLPKVNWDQVASMYLPGRSGAECQSRWLNWEDPLIKHEDWDTLEEKNLLHAVQQKGMSNWIEISASLGMCRTPFQCLSHYQRSLNASILRQEWTEEEDSKLCAAVETYGESNWQVVASVIEGRTGTQCSNRWIKSLHPARKRSGKWSADEDKRLKVAVMLFYPKSWRNIGQSLPCRAPIWKKIAQYVPGRTHVQCRERWVNSLDPSLKLDEWTKEEDLKLKTAIDEHGYCWSKVATCVPPRTDNQCRRRWKVLFPDEVPMLQEAKKIRREAFISNFVDREEERPALKPDDIVPVQKLCYRAGFESTSAYKKKKLQSRAYRRREESEGPESSDLLNDHSASYRDLEIDRNLDGEYGFEQACHDNPIKNKRPSNLRIRKKKSFASNNKVSEAPASSKVESTVTDSNICKNRRTSSLAKKKSRTVASQESSSSSANDSVSFGCSIGDVNSGALGRHMLNKCNRLKNNDKSSVENLPEAAEDSMTLASFINKSRAKRCSFSAKAELNPDTAQSKATVDDHSSRSCISGQTATQDCVTSNQISGAEVGDDDMPLSLMLGRARDHSSRSCISGHDVLEKTSQDHMTSNQIPGAEAGDDDMPLSLMMGRARAKRRKHSEADKDHR